ncbi:hypothetical protein B0O99DRAFT_98166 [Bisporella sp. PMI_857]|nr:hypothetical protein B0O99DRAFT_98166 [Bisporella sp. PMI_857]
MFQSLCISEIEHIFNDCISGIFEFALVHGYPHLEIASSKTPAMPHHKRQFDCQKYFNRYFTSQVHLVTFLSHIYLLLPKRWAHQVLGDISREPRKEEEQGHLLFLIRRFRSRSLYPCYPLFPVRCTRGRNVLCGYQPDLLLHDSTNDAVIRIL